MNDSPASMENCVISGNRASRGGGIYYFVSRYVTLSNCTLTGNITTYNGGGIFAYDSSPTVTNCVIWGNQADSAAGIYDTEDSVVVTFSDIQEGWPARGTSKRPPSSRERTTSTSRRALPASTREQTPLSTPTLTAIRGLWVAGSIWGRTSSRRLPDNPSALREEIRPPSPSDPFCAPGRALSSIP